MWAYADPMADIEVVDLPPPVPIAQLPLGDGPQRVVRSVAWGEHGDRWSSVVGVGLFQHASRFELRQGGGMQALLGLADSSGCLIPGLSELCPRLVEYGLRVLLAICDGSLKLGAQGRVVRCVARVFIGVPVRELVRIALGLL